MISFATGSEGDGRRLQHPESAVKIILWHQMIFGFGT
jgi:hypothetical protein